ncbi:MAG TPA: hypothetical protein VGE52_20125, partial [Pirellulales bacterium]
PTGPLVDPIDKLRAQLAARLELAREAHRAGDDIAAGTLCRTIVEQRVRGWLGVLALTPEKTAVAMVNQLASVDALTGADRQLLAVALTIGNIAAHADGALCGDYVETLFIIARRAVSADLDGAIEATRLARIEKAMRDESEHQGRAAAKKAAKLARWQDSVANAEIVAAAMQGGAA